MLQLIKKDLAIHKFLWFMYLAMLLFFTVFDNDIIFILSLISAVIIMNTFYIDEQANGHKLWNALPFTRSENVGARYASLLLIIILTAVTITIIEFMMNGSLGLVFWKQVIGGIVLVLFSCAFTFPFFYQLAQRKIIFMLFILHILFTIGGAYFFYHLYLYLQDTNYIPQVMSDAQLFSIGIVVSLLSYLLSWRLSIKIYKQREIA